MVVGVRNAVIILFFFISTKVVSRPREVLGT